MDEPVPVRMMNTIRADASGVSDDLRSPADVDAWLDAVGIDRREARTTPPEFASAVALRDAVRRLAAYVTGDSREAAVSATTGVDDALATVNTAADALPLPRLELRDGHLAAAARAGVSPVVAGLAEVAAGAIQLLGASEGNGLRPCYAPGCVLYFVKTHHRREWCSIACGNRSRAARHYEKVRAARTIEE
ncbi:MAG: CGNR zinc finger domain-containing protein [Trebonia sp.]